MTTIEAYGNVRENCLEMKTVERVFSPIYRADGVG